MTIHYIKVLAIAVFSLLLTTCKKDDDGDSVGDDAIYGVYQTLNNAEIKFLESARDNGGNPRTAIAATGDWLLTQPGVAKIDYEDSTNIYIEMESGLAAWYSFVETNAQGSSIFRGGGGGGGILTGFKAGNGCTNKIDNKKILIYAAAYDDFYGRDPAPLQRVIDLFENADDDYEVTFLKNEQCTPEVLATMGNYGLVLLETHGLPESFLSGVKLTIDDPAAITDYDEFNLLITQKLGANYVQQIKEGKILIRGYQGGEPADPNWWNTGLAGSTLVKKYDLLVSSNYISTLPKTPNTIIFGNMCYSGQGVRNSCRNTSHLYYNKPIKEAFMDLTPLSYYCYAFGNQTSITVYDYDAKAMAYELVKNLVEDGDSTGNAHLSDLGLFYDLDVFNPIYVQRCGSTFNLRHYGHDDYCFGGCGDTIIDARDGQKYATTCIGDQIWMAENLNWAGAGVCYDGNAANCNSYGRLYSINELANLATSDLNPSGIKGICPDGWHVPSKAEWEELFAFCGGDAEAAIKLRSTTGWPTTTTYTDVYGFNMLPSGHDNMGYSQLGRGAKLWSCSYDAVGDTYDAVNAYEPYLNIGNYSPPPDYEWKFSCRCVKD